MKGLKTLLGVTLATAGFGGAIAVGASAATKATKNEVQIAEATNTGAAGDVIYFTPSNHWAEAGATFKLQWYKSGAYVGSTFMSTAIATSGAMSSRTTYYAVTDAAFDAVQVLRFNSEKSTQWNYSNNSSVSGENRWLLMDADCSWDNTWVAGDASGTLWKTVDVNVKKTDQSLSSNTGRIFLNNSNSHFNPVAIRAWGGSASQTVGGGTADASIYHPTFFQDVGDTYYGYCDIPTDITGFKIINCGVENSYDAYADYYCDNNDFTITDAASRGVFYCPTNGNTVTIGGAKGNVAGAELMKKVCEAYDTCDSSEINGFGAYSSLKNYFYDHATDDAKTATVTSLTGTAPYTVEQHFAGMAEGSTAGHRARLLMNNNTTNTAIIIVTTTLFVASMVTVSFFVLRKKKEQ